MENLTGWVKGFAINDQSNQFSVSRNKKQPSLYGLCDMVFNLAIPNRLEQYFSTHEKERKEDWIKSIQEYQDSKSGWFKEPSFNFGLHFKEHSTAFATSALKLLGSAPEYRLKISDKLKNKKDVEKWLKKTPEWGFLYWPGSHRGGGVASVFATLGKEYYPHKEFFNWYFEWLDERADPEVGFWRLGWNHKIKKRLTKQELGGAIHYYWIYEYLNHPIPYPEQVIDATLKLQNELGLWDKDVSYCIDLDAFFSIFRCLKQTEGYRIDDIKEAVLKYLDHTVASLNNNEFLFSKYDNPHRLTGCLEAIAEIYKFMPELLDLPRPWIETLDLTPWI